MKIEAFLLCWNEIDIMPLVIKHYQKFCDKITIMDNYSTDGSDKLAVALGCEVRKFGTMFFDDAENMKCKNEAWKDSDSDYVVVADFDEIFHDGGNYGDDELRSLLEYNAGIGTTIFKTIGWQVMSNEWPTHDLLNITNGYNFQNYAKNIVFSPKKIQEINYGLGAHECSPVGEIEWNDGYYYVLHYKHIGGVQRTIDRYKILQKRLSKRNRQMGWGCHYAQSPAKLKKEWEQRMSISRPLI